MEEWKDIPGYEGRYQASTFGRVRSLDRRVSIGRGFTRLMRGRILRPGPQESGHVSVALGKGNSQRVHAVVLRAFKGEAPEGCEGLHLNHTPSDNRIENLVWGTRSTNLKMDYEVGTRRRPPSTGRGGLWKTSNVA